MIIQIAQFEWLFEWWYFGPCVSCKITSGSIIWIVQFKWRSGGVFQLRISQITQWIAVWMPWPLNRDLGAELRDLLTTSAYKPCAAYMYRAQETQALCIFDWQGTQTRATHLLPLWNAKPQIQSLVCALRNSNIAITSLVCTLHNSNCAIRMIIQIALCSHVKTV